MFGINKTAARAQALRLAAGDSIITIAQVIGQNAMDVLYMEQGKGDHLLTARRVIGHYRGAANAQPIDCPVGQRLRSLRMAAGDTQEALAAKLGIPAPYVSKVERNPMRWSRRTARRMAEAYGVSIDAEIAAEVRMLDQCAAAFAAAEAA